MRTEDYAPRHYWDARLRLAPGSVEAVVHGIDAWRGAQLGKIGLEDYWEAVKVALGLDATSLHELRVDFYSGDRVDDDLLAVIRRLRGQGLKIGLLSNNTPDLMAMLDSLYLTSLFDAIAISAQIGVMKPDAEAYHIVLHQLGVQAPEAVMIDDTLRNLDGARTVGMFGLRFDPAGYWKSELDGLLNLR